MSLMAAYVDGALQTSTTSSDSLSSSSNKSTVDSDTFLTLLVAEMQNQDPLEPTSNTEWVSQYATFTQVEQMSEMSDSMDLLRANSLIGKEVIMEVTSESTGETSYKPGVVDYITMESGKALLVIDEEKYSIDDLDTVASEEYFEAYDAYTEFTGMIDALPSLNQIDKSYENTIGKVYDLYNGFSDYQKEYVKKYAAGYVSSYEAYIKKMEQLGITFAKTTEEKVTTLDDVLAAFNQKMEELMTQINTVGNSIQSSTSGSQSSGGTEASGDATDASQSSGGTQASGDATDASQSSGGTEASGDTTDANQSGDGTQASGDTTDAANAAEQTGNSDAGSSENESDAGDDVLDQLTQDTNNA